MASSKTSTSKFVTPTADDWAPINESIDLLPLPPSKDAWLNDPENWEIVDDAIVQLDDRSGVPWYHLNEDNDGCLQCPLTRNVFHLQSGLLFVHQVRMSFDESTKKVLMAEPGPSDPKKKPVEVEMGDNKVYDASTFHVYERCLALICSSPSVNAWKLSRYPVAATPFPPIRRAQPEELPKKFRQQYAALLAAAIGSPGGVVLPHPIVECAGKSEDVKVTSNQNKEVSEKSTFSM